MLIVIIMKTMLAAPASAVGTMPSGVTSSALPACKAGLRSDSSSGGSAMPLPGPRQKRQRIAVPLQAFKDSVGVSSCAKVADLTARRQRPSDDAQSESGSVTGKDMSKAQRAKLAAPMLKFMSGANPHEALTKLKRAVTIAAKEGLEEDQKDLDAHMGHVSMGFEVSMPRMIVSELQTSAGYIEAVCSQSGPFQVLGWIPQVSLCLLGATQWASIRVAVC